MRKKWTRHHIQNAIFENAKNKCELNPKHPGDMENLTRRLESERHVVIQNSH